MPEVIKVWADIVGRINRAETEASVKDATRDLKADVKLTTDDTDAKAKLDKLKASLIQLGRSAATARANVDVNDKAAVAKIAALQVRLAALDKRVTTGKVKLDGVDRAEAQLLGMDAQLDAVGKKSTAAGSQSSTNFGKAFVSGTTFGKTGAIVTAAGAGLAVLPALAGIQGVAMGTMLAGQMAGSLLAQNKTVQASAKTFATGVSATMQKAIAPMVPAVTAAFGQLSGWIKQIEPQMKGLFTGMAPMIAPVLKAVEAVASQLITFMRAALPAMQPFILGVLGLVRNLLPGLIAIVRATAPVMNVFGKGLAMIGKDLGGMLAAMAPAVRASATVLNALLGALGALLPIVGRLAAMFAQALAPVLVALAGAFKALEPVLVVVGGVLAGLAGAVLGSVVGLMQALGTVIKAIAPSLAAFARALAGAFVVLENSGVIFTITGAFEQLVKPISNLVNALLKALIPILPVVIKLFGLLAAVLTAGMAKVIGGIAVALTAVVQAAPPKLIMATVFALIAWSAAAKTAALYTALFGQESVLMAAKASIVQVVTRTWTAAQWLLNVALSANPIGFVIVALAALAAALVIAWTRSATFRKILIDAWQAIIAGTIVLRDDLVGIWNTIWANTIGRATRGIADLRRWFSSMQNATINTHIAIRNTLASIWNTIWNNTVGRVTRGVRDVEHWIGTIRGWLAGWGASAGQWLWNAGYNVLRGFWNGLLRIWKDVTAWISGIAAWIKAHKGPVSLDQHLLEPAGSALMSGFLSGLKSGAGPVGSFVGGLASWISGRITAAGGALVNGAVSAAKGAFAAIGSFFGGGSAGSGVERWRGVVLQALGLVGLSSGFANQVLYQMQTESGGNPNAINLWDSNAAAGMPSQGLMQVIPPTFAAYHVGGTSWNIDDPLANVAAALNYALHVYGPSLGALGSGHGYAGGTGSARPGWAWVGEMGPELMRMRGGETVIPNRALTYSGHTAHATGGGVTVVLENRGVIGSKMELENWLVKSVADARRKGRI